MLQNKHSIRRFWNPVENRYFIYERPSSIECSCKKCGSEYFFFPCRLPTTKHDNESGGYEIIKGEVCGEIRGRGACNKCGYISNSVNWPDEAHIKIAVGGEVLWSWNRGQLVAIKALVAGDKVKLRTITKNDWPLSRIIGRIPKFAVLKRNRAKIKKAIDQYLK